MRRYAAGESSRALGAEYGCWDTTIRAIVRRSGADIRSRSVAPAARAEVVAAWDAGKSMAAIACEVGCAPATVRVIVERAGRRPIVRSPRGPGHPNWQGGRTHRHGYVLVHIDDSDPLISMRLSGSRYVFEHRLVVARAIGRPLLPGESVHHVNGEKSDNRLENLQLRQAQHGGGQAFRCADCGSLNVRPVPLD